MKILLVEDNPGDARLVLEYLKEGKNPEINSNITHVDRLEKGLQELSEKSFDLVLLDLSLPDGHGLENLTKVLDKAPRVPVVILTGTLQEEESAIRGVSKGAQDYLHKATINEKSLIQSIRYAIERKRLELSKEDFISHVSHELRTPLAALKGSLSNLQDEILGKMNEKQRHSVEIAVRNLQRLEKILSDILEISRLESGMAKLNRHKIHLVPFLRQKVDFFQPEANQKKILLSTSLESDLPEIEVDPDLLELVLNNLLGNALRYANKKVVLEARREGKEIVVSIVNDGPGIPPDRLGDLFKKFIQIDRKPSSGYKGTGLGLALCQRVIDLHEGRIGVENLGNEGIRFHFALPL